MLPRRLKPRTPLDCPACCLSASHSSPGTRESAPVHPWREVKSRRGAPKRVKTEGFACPHQACVYFGISDADVHAIVSDGSYGKAEQIQWWRCQACGSRFSARLHTPLYRLKTPSHRVALVLGAQAGRIGCLCSGARLWHSTCNDHTLAGAGGSPCPDVA